MIEISALKKSFQPKGSGAKPIYAVSDVTFNAHDGSITALLGPNGAGKTTTLRVLATLMLPDAGYARVGNVDVVQNPLSVRAQLGVLSDARGLYTRLTARENIAYYASLRQVDALSFEKRLDTLATLLDMRALLDRRTDGFSTGEKMKVSLARALIHDPQHLILDEPTNGLDVMSTRALRQLLINLRAIGKCIVFSTHIMQEVEQLCDQIVVIANGRSIAQGTASQIKEQTGHTSLEDAFVTLVSKPDPAVDRLCL